MKKILTIEVDKHGEFVEMHLNREGANYLIDRLRQLIEAGENNDDHLMTKDWGGDELTSDQQNQSEGVTLVHHLKLLYWK